jgi:mannose-6-phosphate isomerase
VHLGFRDELPAGELERLVREQPAGGLLALLNHVPVGPGDALLVPAGVPHSIGEGLLIVEIQEPSDHSVILEWNGYTIDAPTVGHLRLGYERALGAVDRSAWDAARLAALRAPAPAADAERVDLLPDAARPFFRLERLRPAPALELEPSFAILIVTAGAGSVRAAAGEPLAVARGDALLVPHGAGAVALAGELEVVRCTPPDPASAPKETAA